MGEVLHLFQSVAHGKPMREFEEVYAVENKGFKDCLHGKSDSTRQVLVMDAETLEEFGIPPGSGKENITTRGIGLYGLLLGQRIRVGEALLEITELCNTCHLLDEIRPGLQEELRGRHGILCRVVEPGKIRRGERIELVEPSPSQKAETQEQAE